MTIASHVVQPTLPDLTPSAPRPIWTGRSPRPGPKSKASLRTMLAVPRPHAPTHRVAGRAVNPVLRFVGGVTNGEGSQSPRRTVYHLNMQSPVRSTMHADVEPDASRQAAACSRVLSALSPDATTVFRRPGTSNCRPKLKCLVSDSESDGRRMRHHGWTLQHLRPPMYARQIGVVSQPPAILPGVRQAQASELFCAMPVRGYGFLRRPDVRPQGARLPLRGSLFSLHNRPAHLRSSPFAFCGVQRDASCVSLLRSGARSGNLHRAAQPHPRPFTLRRPPRFQRGHSPPPPSPPAHLSG
ncbi:hypothetical protein K466DRAFT_115733 [Polyporus arcularius HHB13444]|uniref:Uncharacterized protein n=1 Tax=Polyporus arcularius HHB13444 TaxID=1314778 RepID=A0A5C3PC53_9APHY|nr:hypothetical protein K466DRAFT_115733 [Polyporus arcularius HHB13444]